MVKSCYLSLNSTQASQVYPLKSAYFWTLKEVQGYISVIPLNGPFIRFHLRMTREFKCIPV